MGLQGSDACGLHTEPPLRNWRSHWVIYRRIGAVLQSVTRTAYQLHVIAPRTGNCHDPPMTTIQRLKRLLKATQGQDLIEYALMAGFVAVAAGAVMPTVASSISTIFSEVTSVLSLAASQS